MATENTIAKDAEEIAALKRTWGGGPWQSEPDRVEWRSPTGLPCLIVRNRMGALCGYVGVPPEHRLHGKHYGELNFDAHGGLTHSGRCSGAICHVPRAGETDNIWWLGFDCAHAYDLVPGLAAYLPALLRHKETFECYRDVPYVTARVNHLAEQIERWTELAE